MKKGTKAEKVKEGRKEGKKEGRKIGYGRDEGQGMEGRNGRVRKGD